MPSFDTVSKVDWAEVQNALAQARKELVQRFDFKGTGVEIEQTETGVVVRANANDRVRAALDVFEEKLIRRKVSLKHLEKKDPEAGPNGTRKLVVTIKEGIDSDKAREIIKMIKESKLKVQASIQEQVVRISGKNRDDLQAAIQLLKHAENLDLDLQFTNFRD